MLGIWDWWSKPVCVCKRKMSGVGHFGSKYRLQISRISISREKREILSHFLARNEKKLIKILLHKMDIIVVWIWQWLQWSYFLLEKLKPSIFYYIFTFFTDVLGLWKIIKKGKNLGFWLKLKKVNFSFLVPHFSPRNERLEKTRTRISRSRCNP